MWITLEAQRAQSGRCSVHWSARIDPEHMAVWHGGEWHHFERVSAGRRCACARTADGIVRAPMPGVILAVRVRRA